MKITLLSKALIAIIVALCLALVLVYSDLRTDVRAKVAAGAHALTMTSMRELVFLTEGMKNGSIQDNCFTQKRVAEVVAEIDYYFSDRFPPVKSYTEKHAPKDYLANYRSVKASVKDPGNCR